MRRGIALLSPFLALTGCGPGLEALLYVASGGDDGSAFLCVDGREVFERRPSFGPSGIDLTVDGSPKFLRRVIGPQGADDLNPPIFWVGDGVLWTQDGRDGTNDMLLFDLGPDGRPIRPEGVLCDNLTLPDPS